MKKLKSKKRKSRSKKKQNKIKNTMNASVINQVEEPINVKSRLLNVIKQDRIAALNT